MPERLVDVYALSRLRQNLSSRVTPPLDERGSNGQELRTPPVSIIQHGEAG